MAGSQKVLGAIALLVAIGMSFSFAMSPAAAAPGNEKSPAKSSPKAEPKSPSKGKPLAQVEVVNDSAHPRVYAIACATPGGSVYIVTDWRQVESQESLSVDLLYDVEHNCWINALVLDDTPVDPQTHDSGVACFGTRCYAEIDAGKSVTITYVWDDGPEKPGGGPKPKSPPKSPPKGRQ